MVRPMLASAEPIERLRLVWTRLAEAALTAATLSGSRTSAAMTTPRKEGGRPAAAMACSSDSDRVSASSTTAASETMSMNALTAVAGALGKEIITVAERLNEDEHAVQDHRQGSDEHELGRRILGPELRQREIRQDESQNRERRQDAQRRGCASDAKRLFVVARAADQQAEADDAVQHDRDGGKHRVAGKRILGGAPRQHRGDDQRRLDHGDGEGQQHGAEGLADH